MYLIDKYTKQMKKQISFFSLLIVFVIYFPLCLAAEKVEAISPETEAKIQSLVMKGNLPSLQVAVISENQIVWLKTFGQPAGINNLYKIGSIQKVLISTAVLLLHERGLVDINKDIGEYIPFLVRHPNYHCIPITIKMLLAHRSGLDIFRFQYEWDTRLLKYNKPETQNTNKILNLSRDEFLKESLDSTAANYDTTVWKFKPGTGFHYSNSAYLILSYLIEKVSGESFAQFVDENILKQLEMDRTVFIYQDSAKRDVTAYTRKDDQNIELPFWEGMFTTAEDMSKFMIALLNNGKYKDKYLLKPETIDLMREKHSQEQSLYNLSDDCPFPGYGLGIIYYGDNWYGHGGSTVGYQSLWSFNKSSKKGYVILTNINGLCHGRKNFDSVWATVSAVEKELKSELRGIGYRNYYIAGVVVMIIILVSIRILKK